MSPTLGAAPRPAFACLAALPQSCAEMSGKLAEPGLALTALVTPLQIGVVWAQRGLLVHEDARAADFSTL